MKQAFPSVVGNRALCARLAGDIQSGSFSHAYILSGPHGSGKHTLALLTAAALSCENRQKDGVPLPCGDCPACRKILAGKSPDVIYVSKPRDRATFGVDNVRFLKEDVLYAPNDTEYKIYIVEDAETLTPQAQNAMLLTLEEPPAYACFLLLASDTRTLLETVRSRAPVLRTEPIPREQIAEYLHREGHATLAPAEMGAVLSASDGCIGRALELLGGSERKPILHRRELAERFLLAKRPSEYLPLIAEFGTKREEITQQLGVIMLAVRDLMALRKCEGDSVPLCYFATQVDAEPYRQYSAQGLMTLSRALDAAADRISRNAGVRLVLTVLGTETGRL